MKARRSAAPPAPAPVRADFRSADVLSGRYRLGARIGSGGMADVYEGLDTRLRRPVAVKVFRPGPGPQTEENLSTEAMLLARLQHPGLVTVYDSGHHDDRAYLVMQLVDGPSLHSLLASGPLPQPRVAALGASLAGALAYVHRADIVHRDVKPSNVLLDRAGDPHLADFGIALLADATRHTAPDVLTGTAAYLAPEQVEGGRVGPAADVYALGLVLLECLKGTPEYRGTPLEAAVARLLRTPEVPDWIPSDLAALLRSMTAQAPESRPDAAECAQALAALTPGSHPYEPLPTGPTLDHGPLQPAPHVGTNDLERTHRAAAVLPLRTHDRTEAPGRHRHRRLAVGTALAALSVALGTTLAVAPGTSGTNANHTDAAATTPDHPRPTPKTKTPGGTPTTPAPKPATPQAEPISRNLTSSARPARTPSPPTTPKPKNSHARHHPQNTATPPHPHPNPHGHSGKGHHDEGQKGED
ncbi:serine/threonine-protein kinase [Streptomyces sp. WI03-4A]|nr:serine/threonine-protein kinase [Streptomyces sp. WI03-4A]MDX2594686.1 serine/threonine-protein kinase [Streptomyces sp. WI03-4A]